MNPPMLPVTHRLTGCEVHVLNVLTAAYTRGHLVDYHSPKRLDNGRVAITVTLLQPADIPGPIAAPRDRGRLRRRLLLAAKILAGIAALAATGWGVWLLLHWIHTHPWILLAGFAVAVMVAGATSSTTNSGRGRGHR